MRNTDGNLYGNAYDLTDSDSHSDSDVNTCLYTWLLQHNADRPDDRSGDHDGRRQ